MVAMRDFETVAFRQQRKAREPRPTLALKSAGAVGG